MAYINKYFFTILFFSFIYNQDNKNDTNLTNTKDNCQTIEECRKCNFDELKSNSNCQINGFIKKIKCENKDKEGKPVIEPCFGKKGINSVYIFLAICIIIFGCSFRYQKVQKDSNLKNLMIKLSILKN